jgi:putative acetyltransferase
MEQAILFRPIKASDNALLAKIIRGNIEALKLPTEGTAHSDPTTDNLFQLFQTPGSAYLVLEIGDEVLGGCGIYPSNGLPPHCAELVRFFLLPKAHGKGYGKLFMQQCEQLAIANGYKQLYLESFPDMKAAIHLYHKFGYKPLTAPLGNTGHFACNVWMLKEL